MPRHIAIKDVWRNAAKSNVQSTAAFVREVNNRTALATRDNTAKIVGYCTIPRVVVMDLIEGDLDFILRHRFYGLTELVLETQKEVEMPTKLRYLIVWPPCENLKNTFRMTVGSVDELSADTDLSNSVAH